MLTDLWQRESDTSKKYYSFLKEQFSVDERNYSKLIGRFYTNEFIYNELIQTMINHITTDYTALRIIDPFCGDGRLVHHFLDKFLKSEKSSQVQTVSVSLWDIDEVAIESARHSILKLSEKYPSISLIVDAHVGDSFIEALPYAESYDICITNPPWCILKPSADDIKALPNKEAHYYEVTTEDYCRTLEQLYQYSMPAKRFGRWGINLSRCGAECAIRLLASGGVCGIVLPASFFSDQVSAPLRKWIIEDYNIKAIAYYPAELKLFGSVDQSSATVVLCNGPETTREFSSTVFDREKRRYVSILDGESLSFMRATQYAIPFGYDEELFSIAKKLLKLNTLADYPGLKIGREIDETRIDSKLSDKGNLRFIKGFMVGRYSCLTEPIKYLVEDKIEGIPMSTNYERIAWRDVSRASQKRRMQATILPAGTITGNSLGIVYIPNASHEVICFLLAVMNSMVFEFQARRQLVTNHVASGVLKNIPIPAVQEHYIKKIAPLVDDIICGHADTENELECLVGFAYGLSCNEFLRIAKTFSLSEEEWAKLSSVATKIWGEGDNH